MKHRSITHHRRRLKLEYYSCSWAISISILESYEETIHADQITCSTSTRDVMLIWNVTIVLRRERDFNGWRLYYDLNVIGTLVKLSRVCCEVMSRDVPRPNRNNENQWCDELTIHRIFYENRRNPRQMRARARMLISLVHTRWWLNLQRKQVTKVIFTPNVNSFILTKEEVRSLVAVHPAASCPVVAVTSSMPTSLLDWVAPYLACPVERRMPTVEPCLACLAYRAVVAQCWDWWDAGLPLEMARWVVFPTWKPLSSDQSIRERHNDGNSSNEKISRMSRLTSFCACSSIHFW